MSTPKELAELALKLEEEAAEEAKDARRASRLYGFDPVKVGGYTRFPNVYMNNFSVFKAYNYRQKAFVKDKNGANLYTSFKRDEDGKLKEFADPLEPLDHLILMHLLMWYQRTANSTKISFSKRDLAKTIGKSERQVHRAVKKLKDLGYITESGKLGVPGGHVVQYDIKTFLKILKWIANRERVLRAKQKLNSVSDFASEEDDITDVIDENEVALNE